MQLYDILNPQLFKPLSGRNQWIFADLLMLIWDHCRMSTDYGMGKNEMIRLTEDYLEGAGLEMTELDSGEQAEENEQPTSRDLHSKTVWCIARLRNCGWLEDLEIGYEEEARTAICPRVVPILQAFYSIVHPQTVTYSGKLNKAYQLLSGISTEKAPYENILKEVASAMDELNSALRNLNASIGSFIDQMTQHKTPQEVLDLFEKYEEEIVVAAYQRFKTSDNLFNYREALLEGLDNCQDLYIDALAADYCKVERCDETEAGGAILRIIDRIRDDLTLMGELIAEIDKNHITYRQRAVQRAQFMLLTDGTTQGRINSLLRYYAQTLETPASLFDVDDSPLSKLWRIYPTEILGRSYLKPPVTSRKPTPIEPLKQSDTLDEQELRNAQQALGIDLIAIGRAAWNNLTTWSLREGGSTITQQLAKNMYFTQEKSFIRKVAEMFVAFQLEHTYTKDEILELYVNSIYFGDGYYGIGDACKGYLNKAPIEMTNYECTLMAGIPNAPSVYSLTENSALAEQRQKYVVRQMVKYGYITEDQAQSIIK